MCYAVRWRNMIMQQRSIHTRTHTAFFLGLISASLGLTAAATAQSVTYDMSIDPQASGMNASMSLDIDTAGTLIGAWDPDTNPDSTRTKPGLFGSFGSTDNEPVDVALGFGLDGAIDTSTTGSMLLNVDLSTNVVTMEGFAADLLANGPVSIPATLSFASESFRTRNPDSAYIGVPFDIPIGDLSVTSLIITQTSTLAVGALTETSPNHYDMTLAAQGELTGSIEFLGQVIDIAPTPFPIALTGELVITGQDATLTSLQMVDQSDTQNPGTQLPEFAMDIPTILPPGDVAHVLMNLTLDQITSSLVGDLTLSAAGSEVPMCKADFNNDGTVNTLDFIAFLNAWTAMDAAADFNNDGTINTLDFIAFLNEWVDGCA